MYAVKNQTHMCAHLVDQQDVRISGGVYARMGSITADKPVAVTVGCSRLLDRMNDEMLIDHNKRVLTVGGDLVYAGLETFTDTRHGHITQQVVSVCRYGAATSPVSVMPPPDTRNAVVEMQSSTIQQAAAAVAAIADAQTAINHETTVNLDVDPPEHPLVSIELDNPNEVAFRFPLFSSDNTLILKVPAEVRSLHNCTPPTVTIRADRLVNTLHKMVRFDSNHSAMIFHGTDRAVVAVSVDPARSDPLPRRLDAKPQIVLVMPTS